MPEFFPRTKDIPTQSPLFWVTHKDRYLRQQLIRDIQEETGRDLIVYFADCDHTAAQIDQTDDVYIAELLKARKNTKTDLLLETNGGMTDATEKICAMLRQCAPDLRVIIPRRAKSNGTVIAICGQEVLMGPTSELGPIDPSINGVPVEFVLNAPQGSFNAIDLQVALTARQQTIKLAKQLLSTGMMAKNTSNEIDETVQKLASRDHYHSHGSVIDAREAKQLCLNVIEAKEDDPLWMKFWLLRTMYAYDCYRNGHSKLFEGASVSTAVTLKINPNPSTP